MKHVYSYVYTFTYKYTYEDLSIHISHLFLIYKGAVSFLEEAFDQEYHLKQI
jgi:hypothetical protein